MAKFVFVVTTANNSYTSREYELGDVDLETVATRVATGAKDCGAYVFTAIDRFIYAIPFTDVSHVRYEYINK